jgi:hypothetical protein
VNTEVVVALIVAGFGFLGSVVEVMRRQNNKDHATNVSKLDSIADKIDKVDQRLGGHIDWHAHKENK